LELTQRKAKSEVDQISGGIGVETQNDFALMLCNPWNYPFQKQKMRKCAAPIFPSYAIPMNLVMLEEKPPFRIT